MVKVLIVFVRIIGTIIASLLILGSFGGLIQSFEKQRLLIAIMAVAVFAMGVCILFWIYWVLGKNKTFANTMENPRQPFDEIRRKHFDIIFDRPTDQTALADEKQAFRKQLIAQYGSLDNLPGVALDPSLAVSLDEIAMALQTDVTFDVGDDFKNSLHQKKVKGNMLLTTKGLLAYNSQIVARLCWASIKAIFYQFPNLEITTQDGRGVSFTIVNINLYFYVLIDLVKNGQYQASLSGLDDFQAQKMQAAIGDAVQHLHSKDE